MKKKSKISLLLISVLFLATSCSTLELKVITASDQLSSVNSYGLTTIHFNDRVRPIFPLIDAGIFNSNMESVAEKHKSIKNEYEPFLIDVIASEIVDLTGSNPIIVDCDPSENKFGELDLEWAASLAVENNVDAIIVPMIRVNTYSVSGFGIYGFSYLQMYFYIVGANGSVLGEGSFRSESLQFGGKDVSSYRTLIENADLLAPELLAMLF